MTMTQTLGLAVSGVCVSSMTEYAEYLSHFVLHNNSEWGQWGI